MVIWNILRPFNIVYGHFCNVVIIWYIFHRFGTLCQEKSGIPGPHSFIDFFFFLTLWSQLQFKAIEAASREMPD
jgi:hypothetical protein